MYPVAKFVIYFATLHYLQSRKARIAHSNKIKTATAPKMTGSKGNELPSSSLFLFSSIVNVGKVNAIKKLQILEMTFI